MVVNALSVDVEEYYHGVEFEAALGAARAALPSRVEESVDRVLALLADARVRATFFTVGEVAAAHPAMVRKIDGEGHELGCHGHRHELVWRQTPEEFRTDVRRGKAILEELSGTPVIGYRAPNYSIGPAQGWAFDVLVEEGFHYDSSVYPIRHDRYGDPDAPRFPHEIRRAAGTLVEFPIGTARVLGVNLPIGGGGYFRLLPTAWVGRGIERVNRAEGRPVMFYLHPWELDAGQPRPPMPWHHRFRHYVNLEKVPAKLAALLRRVRFAPARDVLRLG